MLLRICACHVRVCLLVVQILSILRAKDLPAEIAGVQANSTRATKIGDKAWIPIVSNGLNRSTEAVKMLDL